MMNCFFMLFLLISGGSIFLLFLNFMKILKTSKNSDVFKELPPHSRGEYLIRMVEQGIILKHILKNNSPSRDDKQHVAEYKNFLQQNTSQEIKYLKGSISNDTSY